jgi:hypothetical protein
MHKLLIGEKNGDGARALKPTNGIVLNTLVSAVCCRCNLMELTWRQQMFRVIPLLRIVHPHLEILTIGTRVSY